MPSDPEHQPLRLTQSEGPVGTLLDAADEEFKQGLDESAAWRRLRERQAKRSRALKGPLILGVAALAAGAIVWGRSNRHLEVTPERIAAREVVKAQPKVDSNSPQEARPGSVVPGNRPRADVAVRAPQLESTCSDLKARGQIAQAVDCYEQLGTDHGLYKAGQLSANDLGDPTRALRILEARQQKFPTGAERIESELLRARTLLAQGRASEAIAVTDRLLADSSNRLALPQIHSVRAHAFQDGLHDCGPLAMRDLSSLVGEPGELGDDGALRRGQCLETLGRLEEARAAYEDYLKRPEPRSASVARARLDALRSRSVGQ